MAVILRVFSNFNGENFLVRPEDVLNAAHREEFPQFLAFFLPTLLRLIGKNLAVKQTITSRSKIIFHYHLKSFARNVELFSHMVQTQVIFSVNPFLNYPTHPLGVDSPFSSTYGFGLDVSFLFPLLHNFLDSS